jgi:hypothetical protein
MTKKANAFRTRFARAKKGGKWFIFRAKARKMNHIFSFFASEASKKYHNAFFVMYLD